MNVFPRILALAWAALALAMPAASQAAAGGPPLDDARLESWREAFRGAGDRDGVRAFLDQMKEAVPGNPAVPGDPAGPTAHAFLATAELMRAGRRRNPVAKLTGFRKWTKVLDRQVRAAPDDPDIRLLRLAVRANAPSFLGYDDGIEADCAAVTGALEDGFWEGDPAHARVASGVVESVEDCP